MHFLVHESNPQQDVRRTRSNAQLSSFCPMGCARGCTRLYCRHAHPPANGALRKRNTIPTTGHTNAVPTTGHTNTKTRTQSRRRDITETPRSYTHTHAHPTHTHALRDLTPKRKHAEDYGSVVPSASVVNRRPSVALFHQSSATSYCRGTTPGRQEDRDLFTTSYTLIPRHLRALQVPRAQLPSSYLLLRIIPTTMW